MDVQNPGHLVQGQTGFPGFRYPLGSKQVLAIFRLFNVLVEIENALLYMPSPLVLDLTRV